jgi:hypothetical protein
LHRITNLFFIVGHHEHLSQIRNIHGNLHIKVKILAAVLKASRA